MDGDACEHCVLWRFARASSHHLSMGTFERVWDLITSHAGEEFRTKTGLPFTYRVVGTSVVPSRTGYALHINQFRTAFNLSPLSGPGDINSAVRGPTYIYAILADQRIKF